MICPLITVVLAVSLPHEHLLTVSSDIEVKKLAVIIAVISEIDILRINELSKFYSEVVFCCSF